MFLGVKPAFGSVNLRVEISRYAIRVIILTDLNSMYQHRIFSCSILTMCFSCFNGIIQIIMSPMNIRMLLVIAVPYGLKYVYDHNIKAVIISITPINRSRFRPFRSLSFSSDFSLITPCMSPAMCCRVSIVAVASSVCWRYISRSSL